MSTRWCRAPFFLFTLLAVAASAAAQQQNDLQYHTIPPCSVMNTFAAGGAFAANETRTYNVVGSASLAAQGGSSTGCNIPGFSNGVAQVQAVELVIYSTNVNTAGYLIVWAADQPTAPLGVLATNPGLQLTATYTVAVAQASGVGDFKVNSAICTGNIVISVVGYYTKQVQTIPVHPVPGDPASSGTNLVNALAGITDASATKQYVVRLEPGIYDLGTTPLSLKSFVDLVGSGQLATIIRGTGSTSDVTANAATLKASLISSVEVRDLQVQASVTSGSNAALGIAIAGSPITLRNVTVTASNTGTGAVEGVRSTGSNCTVADVTITVSGSSGSLFYGIVLGGTSSSNPVVRRAVINVSGGTKNYGVYVEEQAGATLRDVEVQASGGNTAAALFADYGANGGSFNTVTINDSNLQASGASNNFAFSVTGTPNTFVIDQTKAVASSGLSYGLNDATGGGNTYLVNRSELNGGTGSVNVFGGFSAGASRLAGTVTASAPKCAACYNGSFTALSATCN